MAQLEEKNPSSCDSKCSSCSSSACPSRTAGDAKAKAPTPTKVQLASGSKVKKLIGVISGKGGVGKSLVTSLLATHTQYRGFQTAILDADVTGPSIPHSFGIHGVTGVRNKLIQPAVSKSGIRLISTNILLENETDPVLWRGPIVASAVKQFWTDVEWGDVDYMFVDMPPGTGDVAITVFQSLPIDAIVIVTTPQDMVSMIVTKALRMAESMNIPVLGLIENMSYFTCPDCGSKHSIFGESKVESLCAKENIALLAQLPINPEISKNVDAGTIDEVVIEEIQKAVDAIASL